MIQYDTASRNGIQTLPFGLLREMSSNDDIEDVYAWDSIFRRTILGTPLENPSRAHNKDELSGRTFRKEDQSS